MSAEIASPLANTQTEAVRPIATATRSFVVMEKHVPLLRDAAINNELGVLISNVPGEIVEVNGTTTMLGNEQYYLTVSSYKQKVGRQFGGFYQDYDALRNAQEK